MRRLLTALLLAAALLPGAPTPAYAAGDVRLDGVTVHLRQGTRQVVTVNHTYATPRGIAIKEVQNIVYRDPPPADGKAAAPPPPATKAQHSRALTAHPVMLFRYSALTFNGHRIHYDRPYVTGVEGYPGLIVHGPLQAALLIEYAIELRGGEPPKNFMHRGVNPLFDGGFAVNAQPIANGFDLWTTNPAGAACMQRSLLHELAVSGRQQAFAHHEHPCARCGTLGCVIEILG